MTLSAPIVSADASAGHGGVSWRDAAARHWPLLIGAMALAVPTMQSVARQSWSTEQGAHGPIVLATALWLIWRQWDELGPRLRPGSLPLACAMLVPALGLYFVARVTGILELEGPAMYLVLLIVLYASIGAAAMRRIWFPLLYLLFVFPPPDTLVATITQPLKIGLSRVAVDLLRAMGMPIARTGVIIQVAQYDVLVAAACAGLNSIISLSAICLFYVYVRHNANWRYALLLMLVIVPVAIFSNFLRVLLLILITYNFGDAVAQGFLHEFAGIFMFMVALASILGLDALARPVRDRLAQTAA